MYFVDFICILAVIVTIFAEQKKMPHEKTITIPATFI
jgi:hypothetical protein